MFTSSDGLTPKGEKTRATILAAALTLFREKGYAETTLRDIAGEAGVSLGLTYRYFRSKDELVVAIYEDVATRVVKALDRLPNGTMAERFEALLSHKLRVLSPHKDAFGALLAAAIAPSSAASVLGDSSSRVRDQMRVAFRAVVAGATDAPPDESTDAIVMALYGAHFALLLAWVHDETRGAKRTHDLLATMRDLIGFAGPLLAMPGARGLLERLTGAFAPILWKETVR